MGVKLLLRKYATSSSQEQRTTPGHRRASEHKKAACKLQTAEPLDRTDIIED